MPLSIQSYLVDDPYKPVTENESLQQWDNYCIYSIVCVDRIYSLNIVTYFQQLSNGYRNYDPPLVNNYQQVVKGGSLLAIQTFSTSPIPINFLDYVYQYHE